MYTVTCFEEVYTEVVMLSNYKCTCPNPILNNNNVKYTTQSTQ